LVLPAAGSPATALPTTLLLVGGGLIATALTTLIALPLLLAALAALSLSLLAPLSLLLPVLLLAAASQPLQTIAHLLELRQRLLVVVPPGGVRAEGALRLPQFVAKFVQTLGNGNLSRRHVRPVATPQEIGIVLHPRIQFVLLRVAKRAAQLRGRRPLRAGEVSGCLLHVALELAELLQHLVPLGRQLLRLLELLAGHGLRNGTGAGLGRSVEDLLHAILKVLLARCELVRAARQIAHLLIGLVATQTSHHVLGLAQAVGRSAGIRLPLRLVAALGRTGPAHVVGGFLQALQRLLQARIGLLLLPSLPP
jgi:hypothetical protein